MDRFTAYCDLPFLDAFARLKPDGDPGSSEELDRWGAVNAFLRRAANVVVRANPADLPALVDAHPVLRGLLDRAGDSRLRFDERPFQRAELPAHHSGAPFPWRVYFVEHTTTPHADLTTRLGSLFADAQGALQAWSRLGSAHVVGIGTADPDRLRSWTDLKGRWSPTHSFILSDRYLFANPWKARDNLFALLLSLLPHTSDVPPAVLLIGHGDHAAEPHDAARARQWVLDELRRRRPQLTVHLSVALLNRDEDRRAGLHDRRLFLQYGFVESGASFNDVFRGTSAASTTRLTFSPLVDAHRSALPRVAEELRTLAQTVRAAASRSEQAVDGPHQHPLLIE